MTLPAHELQALKGILSSYSDSKLDSIKKGISDGSMQQLTFEDVARLIRKTGLIALADDLKEMLKKRRL